MSIAFCELLQKNWRFRDENGAVLDQLQLLFPGEPLDGPFPPEGGGAVRRLLTVDQDHRPAAAGVFGPFSGVVGGQAAVQIVGAAGIEGAVGTAEELDEVHQSASSSVEAGAEGRRKEIRVPTPSRETTSNQPPCRSTIHLAMDRPRPVPPVLRSRDWSVR